MYATLTITENSTALVVFEKNNDGIFEEKIIKTYPMILSFLNDTATLSNFLHKISKETNTEQAIWLVGLPITSTYFQLLKVNTNAVNNEINEYLLKYSDVQEKEHKQVAISQIYTENESLEYYTFAVVTKELISKILSAFRRVSLDIFAIESRIASMYRFFEHVLNITEKNIEFTYVDETTNALLINKFGTLVYKQAGENSIEIALQTLKQSARDRLPALTFSDLDCSAIIYSENQELTDINMPSEVIFRDKLDSPYIAICSAGLVLRYLKERENG